MIRDEAMAEFADAHGTPAASAGEALFRIDARMASETTARNRVLRRIGDRWEEISEPGALGWWFDAWRDGLRGRSWICFDSPRVVDDALCAGPLAGLVVCDHRSGEEVADPKALGRRFALGPADAKVFSARVLDVGGSVRRISGDPALHAALAEDLEPAVARLRERIDLLGAKLAAGTGITLAAVRQAEEGVWAAYRECRDLGSAIVRQAGGIATAERPADIRLDADRVRHRAQALREDAEDLLGQYREMSRVATDLLGDAARARQVVAPDLRDHLAAICAHLIAQGAAARMDDGALILDIDGITLRIGDGATRIAP